MESLNTDMQNMQNSPFLQKQFPPNWQSMKPEFAYADVRKAIAVARSITDGIKHTPDALLTYENCPRALDRADADLSLVWGRLNHLESVADTPELRKAVNDLSDEVSEFSASLSLDSELYAKVKAFSESPAGRALTGWRKTLVEETLLDFADSGADLPAEKKSALLEIEKLLTKKTQKYSENVLDATKAYTLLITDAADLDGLPDNAVQTAAQKAKDRNMTGWLFTLEQPSMSAFMRYANNRALRRKLWEASANLARSGEFSNIPLIGEILSLRAKEAEILGRKNFADVVLARRMARNGKTAVDFVEDLHGKFAHAFNAEWRELEAFAKTAGLEKIMPWDTSFVAEKLRKAKYDFDPEALRDYLPFDRVIGGLFRICELLYGIRIEQMPSSAGAWHESVKLFKMTAKDGQTMGMFYTDFVPRTTKRAGAWMNLLSPAEIDDFGRITTPALGVIAGNLSEPVGGKPALLSPDDVETLFHEFGHLVHFFTMDCPEPSLRDVAWDFVEMPSQLMENWCYMPESAALFAEHWRTREKIPPQLFAKYADSKKFLGGIACMRQLSFGILDLDMHINPKKYVSSPDLELECQKTVEKYVHDYGVFCPTIVARFTHLFGEEVGYAAGYYSYKWAEVLDADIFTRFKREGILNPNLGAEFARKILRVGLCVPPEKAFEDFMGRAPNSEALLERSILISKQ